ncbi:MAG: hypothetical protein K6A61_10885 [Butyrivibrio sp.]|nr:hypothetical protein [Butyrivibrio sp.]
MKNKTLLSALIMSLSLCACASGGTADEQATNANKQASVESASDTGISAEEASSEASAEISPSDTGYKKAYIELLEAEQQKIASVSPESEEYEECMESYLLYDVDKDNTPELLIRFGHSEASYQRKLYTYADGQAQLVEDSPSGHTSFYSVPNENGILYYMGHMGCADCIKAVLKDGKTEYEELFAEDINEKLQAGEDADYKPVSEIVPGATYLEEYSYTTTYPIEMYEVIANYSSVGKKADSTAYTYPENNPEFYNSFMQNSGTVNAIALDNFMKTPGEIPFRKLTEKGNIYEYFEGGGEINGVTYADLNSDGIYECVFYIGEHDDYSDTDKAFRVILAPQDGKVYAYLSFSPYEDTVTEDGYFITEPNEYTSERSVKRVLFDKEKCFTFSVPGEK